MMTSTLPAGPRTPERARNQIDFHWLPFDIQGQTSTWPSPHQSPSVGSALDIEATLQQWKLLRQLDVIQNTPESERWPNADWPSEQAFKDANLFIQRLPPTAIHMPDLGLADDGEVNFLWKVGGVHLDLGFYGTGSFSYFARAQDGRKFYGDDIPASNGLPYEIASLIRA